MILVNLGILRMWEQALVLHVPQGPFRMGLDVPIAQPVRRESTKPKQTVRSVKVVSQASEAGCQDNACLVTLAHMERTQINSGHPFVKVVLLDMTPGTRDYHNADPVRTALTQTGTGQENAKNVRSANMQMVSIPLNVNLANLEQFPWQGVPRAQYVSQGHTLEEQLPLVLPAQPASTLVQIRPRKWRIACTFVVLENSANKACPDYTTSLANFVPRHIFRFSTFLPAARSAQPENSPRPPVLHVARIALQVSMLRVEIRAAPSAQRGLMQNSRVLQCVYSVLQGGSPRVLRQRYASNAR